ncbi:MAG: endonuclease III [Deltaproteobacteria bacterium]|nr:endonuclease III [Deltaproteobacteria bacterium]
MAKTIANKGKTIGNDEKKRRERVKKILRELKKLFPDAKIALNYANDWELLVAVVLSAQCTDKKVNEVTQTLFKKYRTLDAYVAADPEKFEKDIKPTGFFRNKTKNILAAARIVKEKHGGKIPKTMYELLALPGVARKTANIVLGNAHGIVEGIAVDTHVKRLSRKLGLTDNKDPDKIEQDLMAILPKSEWFDFTYRLIEYGRKVCPARKHDCRNHPLTKLYPQASEVWP